MESLSLQEIATHHPAILISALVLPHLFPHPAHQLHKTDAVRTSGVEIKKKKKELQSPGKIRLQAQLDSGSKQQHQDLVLSISALSALYWLQSQVPGSCKMAARIPALHTLWAKSGGKDFYLDPALPASVIEYHWCCPARNRSLWRRKHGGVIVSDLSHMLHPSVRSGTFTKSPGAESEGKA